MAGTADWMYRAIEAATEGPEPTLSSASNYHALGAASEWPQPPPTHRGLPRRTVRELFSSPWQIVLTLLTGAALLVAIVAVVLFVDLALDDLFHPASDQHPVVGRYPTDIHGNRIPQTLAHLQALGHNIMLQGHSWEPMEIEADEPLRKGPLMPDSVALVIVDMQPLFYDESSPWGAQGGLAGSSMGDIWQNQYQLARRLMRFSGHNDSVFLTRFVVPKSAASAEGIMRHYYSPRPGAAAATADELTARGAHVPYLLDIMPQLQPLIADGAQLCVKYTPGAFAPDSELSAALDTYFRRIGGRTRTLILVGVETDYCVLSTMLGAFDRYYRVILVSDAVGSSQPNSALAQFDYTFRRFDHLLDLATTDALLSHLS
eukprot:CAMPEP_0203906730 /NCGR_PEP_ID=MMETSP0359-20131031/48318_1 /ASSEMBLY_ACC=CAM_ASM_000338 /TAXON_ID=268821 /ORGANISM="Scrippsiella Hangoei, Strain SHTV-5" /LENGTH=373 /DNA_ID=CAMNT_0050831423 /DNA_START=35 /DNA_END=1156 /DNA_ORIENTATION=-